VKLRGRTTTSERRRGPTLSTGTRGAKQTTPHGPLQRLLDANEGTGLVLLGLLKEVPRLFFRENKFSRHAPNAEENDEKAPSSEIP